MKIILYPVLFALLYEPQLVLGTHWHKLNMHKVCFGAKGHTPGSFKSRHGLTAYMIAIHYKSGGVYCNRQRPTPFSCQANNWKFNNLGVFMTNSRNHPIVPQSPTYPENYRGKGWYTLNGYTPESRLVLLDAGHSYRGHRIRRGETLRVWYGEDLYNYTEGDNGGRSCVDVYALA